MVESSYDFSYRMSNLFMKYIFNDINTNRKLYDEISDITVYLIEGSYDSNGNFIESVYKSFGYCYQEFATIALPFMCDGVSRKDYINIQSLLIHELTHIFHYRVYGECCKYYDNYVDYFNCDYENECMMNEIKFRLTVQSFNEMVSYNKNLKVVYNKNYKETK